MVYGQIPAPSDAEVITGGDEVNDLDPDLTPDDLTAYVRRLSLIAREFPELTHTSASLTLRQAENYRLTSEGVRVARVQPDGITIGFTFHLYHRPSGGNTSSTSDHQYATVAEALADSTRFMQHVRDYIRRRLTVLGDSVAEDYYVGPVLIEDGACKMIYHHASGGRHNFRAWHPFTESDRAIYVKRDRKIIDEKLTIRQDPNLSHWKGKPLVGYFTADANGQAPQAVTLSELYNVAGGFARGSYEFCEVLALSGRLFPTDAIACINAAGVALIRGDAATAHHYLERLMSDQRAFNNVGLLYLLEGNRDKAEVYLQLATANGNCPAAGGLK